MFNVIKIVINRKPVWVFVSVFHYNYACLLSFPKYNDLLVKKSQFSPNPRGKRFAWDLWYMKVGLKQEAQLSQRDRAMLHVIEYFTQGHSRSFEMTPLSRACVSPYWYSIVSMSVSRTVSEIFSVKWHDLENLGYGSFKVIENLVPLSR